MSKPTEVFSEFDLSDVDVVATLAEILSDPIKRISTLYKVKDEHGQVVPFVPKKEQLEVLEDIFIRGERAILIIKARQLGFSTLIDIMICDLITFNSGYQATIIDQNILAAGLKLRTKVQSTFASLPEYIKVQFEIMRSHDSEFSVRRKAQGGPPDDTSSCFAGTNARGGNNQILHISEWGPIQFNDVARSREILTGALPSAKAGITIIETSWMGGKFGDLWTITKRAMLVKAKPSMKTRADFLLKFFPWWVDPTYTERGDMSQVDKECWDYFAELQEHPEIVEAGHRFTNGQILWYFVKAMAQGADRYREYPSVLEEAFMAPVPGAIWAKHMERARVEGRISNFPWDRSRLVYTFWDLGAPLNTRVVYVQFVNGWIHVIDHDNGLDFLPAARVAHMIKKGYPFGGHFFPHDAGRKGYGGLTFAQQMATAGLEGIKVLPVCREIWTGVNDASALIARTHFQEKNCEGLLASMTAYHTGWDISSKAPTSEIIHDEASHDCDAYRYIAEALSANLVTTGGAVDHTVVEQEAEQTQVRNNWWNAQNHGSKVHSGGYKFRTRRR